MADQATMTEATPCPVLIVDDDPSMRAALRQWMRLAGFEPLEAVTADEAMRTVSPEFRGCVISDVMLEGEDGVSLLRRIKGIDPDLPVILITGHGDVPMAVEAMQLGAYDFIEKPFDPEVIAGVLRRATKTRQLILENRELTRQLARGDGLEAQLIGNSAAMRKLRDMVLHFARTDAAVMIIGETGTGKEVVAQALHGYSPRAEKPFVAVNSAALPETMVEAELFGHEAGAFTGAERGRSGRIEAADKGVLFLDEIISMPLSLQPKLLRVLQEKEIDRLGGHVPVPVDIRVISAANIDPRQAVAERSLREDLLFRLNAIEIRIPPLRERGNDALLLFDTFVNRFVADYGCEQPRMDAADEAFLLSYDWPGNVRELRNAAERFVLNAEVGKTSVEALVTGKGGENGGAAEGTLRDLMDNYERNVIANALRRHDGCIADVLDELCLPRRTLNEKMVRLNLRRDDVEMTACDPAI